LLPCLESDKDTQGKFAFSFFYFRDGGSNAPCYDNNNCFIALLRATGKFFKIIITRRILDIAEENRLLINKYSSKGGNRRSLYSIGT
jgi:hypothetical protein